jgi:penicillin-binding protein 2
LTGDSPRLRLAVVGVVAVSLFAALLARLWFLQVLEAPELALRAEASSVREVLEPAPRGRILDREGRVLVDNRASNVVAIDRLQLDGFTDEEREGLLARLSAVLSVPVPDLEERLGSRRVSPYTPVPVAEDVDERLMIDLRERQDEFPGVVARRVAMRSYPHGSLAAHVLGYVGEINDAELASSDGSYQLGDQIGKAGVERTYEADLRGTPGRQRVEVDREGRPIRVISHTAPVQGNDVLLSIDLDAQATAEAALAEGLASAQGHTFRDDNRPLVADAGAVVALDVKEGTVVAMASFPTYDLPVLADGISEEEWAVINPPKEANRAAPFVNRAIQGQYQPGSTWKLVTADAAMRSGLITANYTYNDTGTYTIPDSCTGLGCIKQNAGRTAYGRVDLRQALSVSSDVYFYNLGAQLWIQRSRYGENAIQDVAAMLGFGKGTGVPLPAESGGRVLTKASKAALHAENPRLVADGWYTGNNVNMAIGQEAMLVTPAQLANAYATYANGGTHHALNIALQVRKPGGEVVRTINKRVAAQVDLPASVRQPIVDGLTRVVSDSRGTAYNAFAGFPLRQWGIAGKTGTAQDDPRQDTALFVGWGPTADPQYTVAVVMEQSGFGASAAAPVARRVFGTLSGLETGGQATFTQANGAGD